MEQVSMTSWNNCQWHVTSWKPSTVGDMVPDRGSRCWSSKSLPNVGILTKDINCNLQSATLATWQVASKAKTVIPIILNVLLQVKRKLVNLLPLTKRELHETRWMLLSTGLFREGQPLMKMGKHRGLLNNGMNVNDIISNKSMIGWSQHVVQVVNMQFKCQTSSKSVTVRPMIKVTIHRARS